MVLLSMGAFDMKKFVIYLSIFFAIIAVVDISLGKVFHHLQSRAGGRTGAEYYVCEKATEDIIIMGSSRASYHYVSNIISEKLGLTCFNAGKDGNGIIMHYGRWKLISGRYTPKVIIYDITPEFDIEVNDNQRYVERLKPFSSEPSVREYISTLFPLEHIKLFSNMYRYDSKVFEIYSDFKRMGDYMKYSGYIPLNGKIRNEILERPNILRKDIIEPDPIKQFYLEKLIKETTENGIKLFLVVSPYWKGGKYSEKAYSNVKEIAIKYRVPFFNYVDSPYCDNPVFFNDTSHLNDKGAIVFTEDLVSRISI